MDAINREGMEDTPKVILDQASGAFEISGRSLPEDVNEFYEPILNWLEEYSENPNPETYFVFKLEYFNTASSKMILDIFLKLEEIKDTGQDVTIAWHYRDDEEDMLEAGEEYADMVEVEFEFHTY